MSSERKTYLIIDNEPIVIESNQEHAQITQDGICPTFVSSMGLGGGYVPMITVVDKSCKKGSKV